MSTLTVGVGHPNILLESGSLASGADFRRLRNLLEDAKSDRSRAASSPQSTALSELARIAAACSAAGWDGYDARPISATTQRNARAFLEGLPMYIDAPAIVPEPDGEVAIEWDLGPQRIFSVSIGETGKLHYAGLFGFGVERHGVEPFAGMVSAEVLGYVKRLLDGATGADARRAA